MISDLKSSATILYLCIIKANKTTDSSNLMQTKT